MTTTKVSHRTIASLKLPRPNAALILYAQSIVTAMTSNPSFANPSPPLAALSSAIADLQTSEAAALSRVKGAVATRNEKRTALVSLLQATRSYVESPPTSSPARAAARATPTSPGAESTVASHERAVGDLRPEDDSSTANP